MGVYNGRKSQRGNKADGENPPTNEKIMEWLKNPASHPEIEAWYQENKEFFRMK